MPILAHLLPALPPLRPTTRPPRSRCPHSPPRTAVLQLPLAELAGTFYSTLKSHTSGYATFDYEPGPHRSADLVRLDFLIHGSPVDALSRVLHRADAVTAARAVCQKLVGAVSRQAFEVRDCVREITHQLMETCAPGRCSHPLLLLCGQSE